MTPFTRAIVAILIAAIAIVCTGWFVTSRYSLRSCTVRTISEAVRFTESHPECRGAVYVEGLPPVSYGEMRP